ncbi:MAG: glycosyltransferase family 2 protein [Acidimicrobiales bacterium]
MTDGRVAVVVATYNRCSELLNTLGELIALPERPQLVVVDNASTDGTAAAVRRDHPDAVLVRLDRPRGSSARNLGVQSVDGPYVAFADDDSWWTPGSLATAAGLFDRHPRLALITAKVLVGPGRRVDPISEAMATGPLAPDPSLPGVPVLGFLACAAIVRREAFQQVGGFHELAGFGGEETLLAMDLAAHGWGLSYVEDVVAVHHPSPVRNPEARAAQELGNTLLRSWLRLPLRDAIGATRQGLVEAGNTPAARRTVAKMLRVLPGLVRDRRVAPGPVLADLQALAHDGRLPRFPLAGDG